jgi:enamine deaminase RidA (YjgF/YER057c/UK114 family)
VALLVLACVVRACSVCSRPWHTSAMLLRSFARRSSSIVRVGTDDPRMSKVVVHGGTVYLSGQTASDAGDTVEEQTAGCLRKVDDLLASAGTSKSRTLPRGPRTRPAVSR